MPLEKGQALVVTELSASTVILRLVDSCAARTCTAFVDGSSIDDNETLSVAPDWVGRRWIKIAVSESKTNTTEFFRVKIETYVP